MTDMEIASNTMLNIKKIAKRLGYNKKHLLLYGDYKAKLKVQYGKKHGKLILVTAINPTSTGIGKTTVSIGLADALRKLNKNACLALREPSLGPVFGIKGGATGGGYAQIVPMDDINLHFNGDFHAITSANNLLASMIDNHIFQGNDLKIDINKIFFHRCLDLNDRSLREVEVGLGTGNGIQRFDKFTITAASETMAILALCTDFENLKTRLGNILIGLNLNKEPVFAKDLKANEAMAILLKDAYMPNLVQTLEGTPAIVHCGPFANIAHGCNSIIATKLALSYADYVVTEAGFGADLGAEKFFDLKCRIAELNPDGVVIVATIQALKLHGGANKERLSAENTAALKIGIANLEKHLETIYNVFKIPAIVTLNKFKTDTIEELKLVQDEISFLDIPCIINDVWGKGGDGATELAENVIKQVNWKNDFEFAYELNDSVKNKISSIATKVYGAQEVVYELAAEKSLLEIERLGFSDLPVIIAKTQYSLADDATLLNRPENFTITIRDIEIRAGAGFLVALAGKMLLMPGLNKAPNALNMEIDKDFIIKGLF